MDIDNNIRTMWQYARRRWTLFFDPNQSPILVVPQPSYHAFNGGKNQIGDRGMSYLK